MSFCHFPRSGDHNFTSMWYALDIGTQFSSTPHTHARTHEYPFRNWFSLVGHSVDSNNDAVLKHIHNVREWLDELDRTPTRTHAMHRIERNALHFAGWHINWKQLADCWCAGCLQRWLNRARQQTRTRAQSIKRGPALTRTHARAPQSTICVRVRGDFPLGLPSTHGRRRRRPTTQDGSTVCHQRVCVCGQMLSEKCTSVPEPKRETPTLTSSLSRSGVI